MSTKSLALTDQVQSYLVCMCGPIPDVLADLRAETLKLPMAMMQISIEQGKLMQLLIQLMGAKKTLEIGVFTGYSSLVVALALPDDGRIVACDVSEEWTSIGRPYWKKSGVEHKIELRIAPAVETLDQLLVDGQGSSFDFAFIDADKSNYDAYYERVLKLVRPGGLIAFDNVLWSGKVADPSVTDADTMALRALNSKLCGDERVCVSMIPIGDGLTLALRK